MTDQYMTGSAAQDLDVWAQGFELDQQRQNRQLVYEKQGIDQRKNLQLAELDKVDAVTIQQKIAVEQQKTAIEVQAIQDRTAIELREIDRRTEADIRAAEKAAYAKGIFDDEHLNQIRDRIRQMGEDEKSAASKAAGNEVDVAQAKGASDTRKIVVDQYRSIFDSLKTQAGKNRAAPFTRIRRTKTAVPTRSPGRCRRSAVWPPILSPRTRTPSTDRGPGHERYAHAESGADHAGVPG